MKTIVLAFILGTVLTANSQDDTTARFYGLPDNVTACQMMQGTYNGETKELKPIVQEQMLFSNGVATIIKKAEVIGSANFASEYTMTYDVDGKLKTKGIISMQQNSTEPYKETFTYKYTTTNGVTRVSYTTQNGKQYVTEDREYDKNGKLYKTTWLDQKGNKKRTITFHGDNDETFFYEGETNALKTNGMFSEVVYYLDNQKMNKTLMFLDDKTLVTTLFVTEYKLDVHGNLLQEKELHTYREATANERRIMYEPNKPADRTKIKADELIKEINYSNYLVNDKWVIQIPEVITNNMIDFKFRAMQTTDGATYTINDQNAIMAFLNQTYQKIKAKKQ